MVDIICLIALLVTAVAASWPEGFSTPQHSIVKRMDLETCLVRFDVHLNTIIRTEESRSMGANFLDDADVSSREQCLRLCCETEKCDVFVFEEKNQGTCFLFQCGPSNDFHCKFTHHANYTSAVLKNPSLEQPPPPLVSQIHSLVQPPSPPQMAVIVPQLSQHERELVNLKAPKTPPRSEQTTLAPLPPLGVQLGQLPTTTTPKPTTPTQCGHYEFPCHSGECIAIYNACDGIPQCSDGSDEGPECRRPPPIKPFQPSPVQQQPQQQQSSQISTNQISDMPAVKSIISQVFQPDVQQQQLRGLQEQQKLRNQIPHNREDPMTAPKAWPRPVVDQQSAYIDTPDSRIFNHKGGLQLSSNNIAASQYQFPETSYVPNIPRNNPYMPIPDSFQPGSQWNDPRISPPQRPMWPQTQQLPQEQYVQPPPQHQPDVNQLQPVQTIPSNPPSQMSRNPPQPQAASVPVATDSKPPAPNAETAKNSENHKSGKSSEEYESYDEQQYPEKPSAEDQEEEKPEPPQQKKKPRKHHHQHQHDEEHKKRKSKTAKKDKAVHGSEGHMPPVHEHLKMLRSDLEIEFADHDGQAERPGGAVLSLTLGAILTAALAILIGCRMKVARRRIRRQGKGSYAHDADFLVNGMYL